jgi:hypothetical protein
MEAEVAAITHDGDCVTRVALASGERLSAPAVVNAAGPWASKVALTVGAALPISPTKRQVTAQRHLAPAARAAQRLAVPRRHPAADAVLWACRTEQLEDQPDLLRGRTLRCRRAGGSRRERQAALGGAQQPAPPGLRTAAWAPGAA